MTELPVLIGGIEYVPRPEAHPVTRSKVGVAITTRNRPEMLTQTIDHVRQHTPGATLVVVDDASSQPFSYPDGIAVFRFDKQAGIARAKNKCIELLMDAGCDELFLLDDDCYPIADGWTDLYVDHPEPHLCYLFKDPGPNGQKLKTPATVYDDGRTFAYEHPRGCMLYLNRSVVEACGGERTVFGIWGHEHVEYSLRIHHTGLTTNVFQDASGSSRYIHSIDEHYADYPNFQRSVSAKERAAAVERNDPILAELRDTTTGYVEYRDLPNVVITTLLTKVTDPQRGQRMKPDLTPFTTWADSLRGCVPIVLHDELPDSELPAPAPRLVRVTSGLNPYLQRWVSLYHYLRDNRTGWTWSTDGTDVEMLREPWDIMQPGRLYVGHEPTVVGIPWMLNNHKPYRQWIEDNADLQLLNAGAVGGDHATMLSFAHDMVREIFRAGPRDVHGDMAAFNYVARLPQWRERVIWGSRWVTAFKANERNGWSVWRHK
jgi:hypothetical protein